MIRSLAGDSSSPSALRQLRLAPHGAVDDEKVPRVHVQLREREATAATGIRPSSPGSGDATPYFPNPLRIGLWSPPQEPVNPIAVQEAGPIKALQRRSFLGFSGFLTSKGNSPLNKQQQQQRGFFAGKKGQGTRSASRNGPNGIVISAPIIQRPASPSSSVVDGGCFEPAGPATTGGFPLSQVPPPPPPPVYHYCRGE